MKEQLHKELFGKLNTLLFSRRETAEILGMSTSTLDRLKQKGMGPKFQKNDSALNSSVKYSKEEIINYIDGNNNETFN